MAWVWASPSDPLHSPMALEDKHHVIRPPHLWGQGTKVISALLFPEATFIVFLNFVPGRTTRTRPLAIHRPAWDAGKNNFFTNLYPKIPAEFLASQCIETIMIYLNTFQYITMIHLGTWCHLLGILQSWYIERKKETSALLQYSENGSKKQTKPLHSFLNFFLA